MEKRAKLVDDNNNLESEIHNDLPIILLGKQNVVSVFLEGNTKIIFRGSEAMCCMNDATRSRKAT